MKKTLLFGLIFLAINTSFNKANSQGIAYQPDISYQTFYDELSPYGQWINYPRYGYVWSPDVDYDFKPYATNGHWVYSDIGWTWVSGYDWGWAAFHYGRWFYDGEYGWLWMPGTEWAPAWVSWRTSNDYYGWAPLLPNISIDISIGSYNPPYNYWCFVPHQYINHPYVYNYYINENRNLIIINNTTVINNTCSYDRGGNQYSNSGYRNDNRSYFASGPNPREVEHFTRNAIRPVAIRDNDRPGRVQVNNNEISLFRPGVNAGARTSGSTQQRFAPARLESSRPSERVVESNRPGFVQQAAPANDVRFNNNNNNRLGNFFGRREQTSGNSNGNNNAPAMQRQDNRPSVFDRRIEPVNNQAASAPVDNRRSFFNNDNRNFQAARQQAPENRPAFNDSRQMQSPVYRANPGNISGGNGYQQERVQSGRVINQPTQNFNRPFTQQTTGRSIGNSRESGRRER